MKILIDFIITIFLVIIFNIITDSNLFQDTIGSILIVIGFTWILAAFFSLPLTTFKYCGHSIGLGILLLIIGACLELQIEPPPVKSDNEIGNCPQAEWQLIIKYKEYGLTDSFITMITGDVETADLALKMLKEEWNKKHPDKLVFDSYKILCYIPPSHAKKVGAPVELQRKYY